MYNILVSISSRIYPLKDSPNICNSSTMIVPISSKEFTSSILKKRQIKSIFKQNIKYEEKKIRQIITC